MPNPIEAIQYGGLMVSPFKAMGSVWGGVTGKVRMTSASSAIAGGFRGQFLPDRPMINPRSTRKFGGMYGYKTLLLGVNAQNSSLMARASLGNVVLSTAQTIGQGLSKVGGGTGTLATAPIVKTLATIKDTGITGLFSTSKTGELSNLAKAVWRGGGVDPANLTRTVKDGITTFSASKNAIKKGVVYSAATKGGRLASVGFGLSSIYSWGRLFAGAGKAMGDFALEGVGEAARAFFQYVDEIQRPEFGKGRVNIAMASAGAATERQRAVRATYGAKINPTNRLMGTEASYHHA
jgi:hypothetical protein